MKRFPKALVLTVAFVLIIILLAKAERYTSPLSHDCWRPLRPLEFSSQWQVEEYRKEVEAYRNCLIRFVEEQKEAIRTHEEAIRKHKEAAEAAIQEWKDFLESEKLLEQLKQ